MSNKEDPREAFRKMLSEKLGINLDDILVVNSSIGEGLSAEEYSGCPGCKPDGIDEKVTFPEFLSIIANKMKARAEELKKAEAEKAATSTSPTSDKAGTNTGAGTDKQAGEDENDCPLHPAMEELTPSNCVKLLQEMQVFMTETFGSPLQPSSTAADRAFTYLNALLTRMDEMRNNNVYTN